MTTLTAQQSGVETVVLDSAPVAVGASVADAASGNFFRRQLTKFEESEQYFVTPSLTTSAFPVDRMRTMKEFFVYGIKRFYGEAVIAECCDKVPTVGISRCEVSSGALTIQSAAKWCYFDVERAREAGENIEADHFMAAQEALEVKLEKLIWGGYTPLGVTGILNNTTLNRIKVGGLGPISNDMIRLIATVRNSIVTKLNGRAAPPNTLAVPPSIYASLQTSVVGYNDRVLLGEIQSRFGLTVIEIPYLENAGKGGTPIMAMYRREPNYIRVRIPIDTESMPIHWDGSHYCQRWYTRFAGVRINQPETFAIIEGLGVCGACPKPFFENCHGTYNCSDA